MNVHALLHSALDVTLSHAAFDVATTVFVAVIWYRRGRSDGRLNAIRRVDDDVFGRWKARAQRRDRRAKTPAARARVRREFLMLYHAHGDFARAVNTVLGSSPAPFWRRALSLWNRRRDRRAVTALLNDGGA